MGYTVFIDLDDTLLDSKKRISGYTIDILQSFQKQGNNIVFATARSRQLDGLQDCIKTITPHFIFHNGGEVVSNGKMIYQDFFSKKETERIGRHLTENSIQTAVILDDAYYANYDATTVWGNIRNFRFTDFTDVDFRAPKFSVLLNDESQIAALNELKDSAEVTFIDHQTSAIIAPENVSKGLAVRILLDLLPPFDKSIFIGNDHNDLTGFAVCDTKVAVANAEPAILEEADIVIGSNDDDGVAKFLHDICRD